MPEVRARQYFGPGPRHPQACIELSFHADTRLFDPDRIAADWRAAGITLSLTLPARLLPIEEATGALASAMLAKFAVPAWTAGRDGALAWVCLSHAYPTFAQSALVACHAAVLEHAAGRPVPDQLRGLAGRTAAIDPIADAMMTAAADLGLEATTVSHRARIYQIGQGANARHHFELASQDDGFTGVRLAIDKLATADLLRRMGLPTTRAISLGRGQSAASVAAQVGFPCVVKPVDRGKGKGITTRIADERQLAAAVEHALQFGSYPLLVENHIEGDDHRMTVVAGKLLWVYRLRPASVIGDGATSLEGLIQRENLRRQDASPAHKAYLLPIAGDAALLQYVGDRYGFDLQAIPPANARIELSGQANLARGGTLEDVTAAVHPDNIGMAVRVARLFRLDVLGIDFITPDIGRSWRDTLSAIVEVNAVPGISGMGDASLVLRTAMPTRRSGRVPSFVIAGTAPFRERTEGAIAAALMRSGLIAARADYPGSGPSPTGLSSYAATVDAAILDPSAQAIVVSCAEGSLIRFGFPLRRCDVVLGEAGQLPAHAARLAGHALMDSPNADAVEAAVAAVLADAAGTVRRPILELHSSNDGGTERVRFILRCWRVRPQSRARFWQRVADGGTERDGVIGHADLAAAVVRLADVRLAQAGEAPSAVTIAFPPVDGAWQSPYVEADVGLPSDRVESVGTALAHAVATVNDLLD